MATAVANGLNRLHSELKFIRLEPSNKASVSSSENVSQKAATLSAQDSSKEDKEPDDSDDEPHHVEGGTATTGKSNLCLAWSLHLIIHSKEKEEEEAEKEESNISDGSICPTPCSCCKSLSQ